MKFDYLSKYFPPPKFLKPPHIGISFSDQNIKAIFFDKISIPPYLKSIIVPIEKGIIVSGSIVNMEEVVKKLSLIRETFSLTTVFFTIPDELIYVFSALVPVGSGSNITESVAFIMEENVPLPLSDTVFDFVPTKIVHSESELKVSVVVTACARKEVEKFIEILRRAGFSPIGCVHESQAVANAVISHKSTEAFCIVHAKEKRIGIYLVKNNLVHFSTLRSIVEGDYKKQFLDEYEKFSEYYSKYDTGQNQPIKSVFVCGEFEYAKEIIEAIIDFSDTPKDAKLSNVWVNAFEINKFLPSIPYEESLNLSGPIGAVLSDIN